MEVREHPTDATWRGPARLHRRIYYVTAGFLVAATVLRSILLYEGEPRVQTVATVLLWLAIFVLESLLLPRRGGWFVAYLVLQTGLILFLLSRGDGADYFAILFAVLAMQAGLRLPPAHAALAVGGFVVMLALPMAAIYEPGQAIAFVILYSAAAGLVLAYAVATRQAAHAAAEKRAIVAELDQANRRLEQYSGELERLAVARERHRLARELHDSVTQTVFSMTLTTQSAELLLRQDPGRVREQLDRLAQLARGALSEMQLLISELRPQRSSGGDLVSALRLHLAQRATPHGVTVALEVEGAGALSPTEEENLLRIAQEAINNVVKHARTNVAGIRLRLEVPYRLEVTDEGRGFRPHEAAAGATFGLRGMRERAAEIGWEFRVVSEEGAGTRITVEKPAVAKSNPEGVERALSERAGSGA